MSKYNFSPEKKKYNFSPAKTEQNQSVPFTIPQGITSGPNQNMSVYTPPPIPQGITSGPNQNISPYTPPAEEKKPVSPFSNIEQPQYKSLQPRGESLFNFGSETPQVPQLLKDLGARQKKDREETTKAFSNFKENQQSLLNPIEEAIRKPIVGTIEAGKRLSETPADILSHPAVTPVTAELAKRTSGIGIQSMVQAVGPKTFEEAYQAQRALQAGDPSKLNQFWYQLKDSGPQTLIGVALNFVPYAGRTLSTAYWTALSANEQTQDGGRVESMNPIVIDVLGDRMLGNSIEGLFKAPANTLKKTLIQNFGVEGGTEVAQDLLKYQEAYLRADTEEKKAQILKDAKEYFTSGQILMTFGVGGVSGAAIGTAGYTINQSREKEQERHNSFLNSSEQQDAMFNPNDPGNPPPPPPGSGSQGTPVYRGGDTNTIDLTRGGNKGISVSTNKSTAENFTNPDGSGGVGEAFMSPSANILQESQIPTELQNSYTREAQKLANPEGLIFDKKLRDSVLEKQQAIIDYARENGFDGVSFPLEDEIRVLNPDILKQKNPETGISNNENKKDNRSAGHKRLTRFTEQAVQNRTMLPEEAVILESLYADTSAKHMDRLVYDFGKGYVGRLGNFSRPVMGGVANNDFGIIKLKKGIYEKGEGSAARVFTHEFGHSGFYMVLNESERAIVEDVYRKMGKAGRISFFKKGLANNPEYHGKNERAKKYDPSVGREFFAESFAEYIFSNKVPAAQMEPILKKLSRKFFEGLKRLVHRGDTKATEIMRPIYEKILAGDRTTPLSEFANKEPPSFKSELRALLNGPNSEQSPNKEPEQPPLDSLFPGAHNPPLQRNPNAKDPSSPIEPVEVEPPTPVDDAHSRTPVRQKIGILDRIFRSPVALMKRLGLHKNYIELKKANLAMNREAVEIHGRIRKWKNSLPKESSRRIFDFLDGEKVELTQEETAMATQIREKLNSWADRLGLEQNERITNYITHVFPREADSGIPEGIEVMLRKSGVPGQVYNPFLLERTGAEGYIKDVWLALEIYEKRANRKVHMDPPLANLKEASEKLLKENSQKEFVEDYAAMINMRPTKIDKGVDIQIQKVFGNLFGSRPTRGATLFLRKMVAGAKIAGSPVTFTKNLTQGVNTYSELGATYTVVGYTRLFEQGAGQELKENGVLLDSFIQDQTYSAVKQWAERYDKVLYANMNASEFVNRGAAYFGAKEKYLAGKVKPKDVKKALNKDVQKGYEVTEQDAIDYGKFVAEATQFTFGALDTPVGLQSDIAKTLFQFQTFTVKQMERIGEQAVSTAKPFLDIKKTGDIKETMKQIKDSEWDKFARYLFASSLLFTYIGRIFGMGLKDVFPFIKFGYPPIWQFVKDIWDEGLMGEDEYGNELDTEERLSAVGKSLFTNIVPMGASIKRGYEGIQAVSEGKDRTASGKVKHLIEQTPTNYARAALFGKYNLSESQEYYKEQDEKKDKKKSGSSSSSGKYNFGPAR
jgi:hypothetical protein